MRRSPFVIVATAAGLAGVLAFPTKKPPTTLSAPASPSSTSPTSSGSAGSTTTTSPPGGLRSATGKAVQYGYGRLAVQLSVHGSRITGAKVVGLATADSYSQQIAVQVIPMLRREVLSAQSAHVQTITGATYTSLAYLQSTQAALTKLHA